MTGRPLLFLDVDGPLLPFSYTREHERLARLGHQLTALPCDLVWATTWEDRANTELASQMGLPNLPAVTWPDPSRDHEREDQWFGLHWKTRTLVTWAAGRPFAWIDDELTNADRDWVSTHHPSPALLHRVNPFQGLTDEDLTTLDHWLRTAPHLESRQVPLKGR